MFGYRWGLLVVLLGAALVSTPTPTAQAATTITVTTADDELTDDGDCALREAIRAANLDRAVDACPAGEGADTIILPAGTYTFRLPGTGEDAGLTGDLDVTADLTISGAGADITAVNSDGLDRVFDSRGGVSLTISGLTVRNGRLYASGGGIRSDGTLRLIDAVVSEIYSNGPGAIYGVNVTLIRTVVRNTDGGGVDGPGLYLRGVSTVADSVIEGNSSFGAGGILNTGALTVTGSTIRNNGSIEWGGIYNSGASSVLVIERSLIIDNHGGSYDGFDGSGGGGLKNEGRATIRASAFLSNTLSDGGAGAGILNYGTLLVVDSTIAGNSIDRSDPNSAWSSGGGLSNFGDATLVNTTVSGNQVLDPVDRVGARGGGIHNYRTLTLRSSTVSGNRSDVEAGGVNGDVAALANSIVAGNTAAAGAPDCAGTLTSLGYNLIGDTSGCTLAGSATGNLLDVAPQLGPLADNGGPTPTQALLPGSPAIDAGNPAAPGDAAALCPAADQRGTARPQDGDGDGAARCDIGAYEADAGSQPLAVSLDVRPQRCPNLLNGRSRGTVSVVIAGDASLDVAQIDPATLRLAGLAPQHSQVRDAAAPFLPYLGKTEITDCQAHSRPDGRADLVLHFDERQLVAAIKPSTAAEGQLVQLTGALRDGTPIIGEDIVVIVPSRR